MYGNGKALEQGPAAMTIGSGRLDQNEGGIAKARESHVASEMTRLMKVSEYLHQMLSELEERLAVVMRPEGPSVNGQTPKEPMALVPLASGLADVNMRLDHACGRVRSLTQRIEL